MSLRYGLIVSISLHLAALLLAGMLVAGSQKGNGDDNGKGNQAKSDKGNHVGGSKYKGPQNVNIKEKPQVTEVSLIEEKHDPIMPKRKQKHAKKSKKECPDKWFGGVGIELAGNIITTVYSGYPADKAGLQKDDWIMSTSDDQIVGKPGTTFTMKVLRKQQVIEFTITRGKICI